MTEIEKALLDALESLQSEHEQQLSSFAETLQSMRIEHAKGSKLWAEAAATLQGRYGVVRRNPRNFRQPSSSPATSASRSMNLPSVWKV
ncbi:MbeD/MobD family mobilization/exclusion protein [Pseudomonas sp. FSL A6-1183]|uniref:MbeD/MobD family mobilization/exclusion protein n=1 Tax=Pseudomonas sp. FSL A6-1183 TaxID=2662191 RepID=UPI0034CEFEC5